ncbi:hypothetical protein C1I95_28070 [Micromonospora craterilacus]|uniref:Uncharacterized protein n=1 Tax=Micromonospora craterilacus TaxID=1655439 RepID=A0A2W2DZC1_9ACTN|nr:hypothetical protein C1I95_28070 [Micromonospora craterilacus]
MVPRRRPRSWLAGRLRSAARAVDRIAGVVDASPTAAPASATVAGPTGGTVAGSAGESGAGSGGGTVGGVAAAGAGAYRRPGQPPEHWLRVVAAHAPGLLRDLAVDAPPGDAATDPDGASWPVSLGHQDPDTGGSAAGAAGPDPSAPHHRPAAPSAGTGTTSPGDADRAGDTGPLDGTSVWWATARPAAARGAPGTSGDPPSTPPFALLQPTQRSLSGDRTPGVAWSEAEQRGDAGVPRVGPGSSGGTASPGGTRRRRAGTAGRPPLVAAPPGTAAAGTSDTPAADDGRPDRTVGGFGTAAPDGGRPRPTRLPAVTDEALTRIRPHTAPDSHPTESAFPRTGPGPHGSDLRLAGTGPTVSGTSPAWAGPESGQETGSAQGARSTWGTGWAQGTGSGQGTGSAAGFGGGPGAGPAGRDRFGADPDGTYPGPGRAGRDAWSVADRYRTAGDGPPGLDGGLRAVGGRAGGRRPGGDGFRSDGGLPTGGPLPGGDGLWPGSGLPAGAGRWPDGATAPWPAIDPPGRPGGRWRGPDPWPALPDDRPLWSVPDPAGADSEHLRRLDREQAGG